MRKIKTGIIGIGNMGTSHAINLTEDHCPEMELTAVADTSPERRAWAKENLPGVCVYGTAEELLDSGRIEAVIIAVPHYFHPVYAIEAFKRGIHVMSEKPAGV